MTQVLPAPSTSAPTAGETAGQAAPDGVVMKQTRTYCIPCSKIIPGTLIERDGDVYMRKHCPVCGDDELLYWKDAELYRTFKSINNDEDQYEFDYNDVAQNPHDKFTTTFDLDVTSRCNLTCPVCFPQANDLEFSEPTTEEIVAKLPARTGDRNRYRPNVNLLGGESTLRKDLPEIIRIINERGYEPRLSTNGIALYTKEGYLEELYEAGLRWILLQFDSFDPKVNKLFRGRDLLDMKFELIEKLCKMGFYIHLSVMTIEGYNDREIHEITKLSMKWPHIRRLSFYPVAAMGRNAIFPKGASTQTADLLETIEKVSEGNLRKRDLINMKRIWKWMYRLTKKPVFKQRICIIPYILYGNQKSYFCVSRFLEPWFLLTHIPQLLDCIVQLPKLMRFDEGRYKNLLVVNIESFYDTNSIDLEEAVNCHQTYITSQGLIPFCLYNSVYRPKFHWQKGKVDFKPDITKATSKATANAQVEGVDAARPELGQTAQSPVAAGANN